MKQPRVDIASIRREQIVDAAVAVIAEQGLQHLSLSEIEKKVGMSRGQLTYYFKAKEDILVAVFDRLIQLMREQHQQAEPCRDDLPWLEKLRILLSMVMKTPPAHPEFHALQYTFLSQISHRADYRQRLVDLYEEWRLLATNDLVRELEKRASVRKVSPRSMATLVQAILHGLAMQTAADPESFDPQDMLHLCLDLLGTYLWIPPTPPQPGRKKTTTRPKRTQAARYRTPLIVDGVEDELDRR